MPTSDDSFDERKLDDDVLSCVEELTALLPQFICGRDSKVFFLALSAYLGRVLRGSIDARICTSDWARDALVRVQALTFPSERRAAEFLDQHTRH